LESEGAAAIGELDQRIARAGPQHATATEDDRPLGRGPAARPKSSDVRVVLGFLRSAEGLNTWPQYGPREYQPRSARHPDPNRGRSVERLAAAKRPIILGGRGVLWSGSRDALIKLADRCGALLSNTLPRVVFSTITRSGSASPAAYFTALGKEMYESADVVSRGSVPACPTTSAAALLAEGLQDPVGRRPARACAMG